MPHVFTIFWCTEEGSRFTLKVLTFFYVIYMLVTVKAYLLYKCHLQQWFSTFFIPEAHFRCQKNFRPISAQIKMTFHIENTFLIFHTESHRPISHFLGPTRGSRAHAEKLISKVSYLHKMICLVTKWVKLKKHRLPGYIN